MQSPESCSGTADGTGVVEGFIEQTVTTRQEVEEKLKVGIIDTDSQAK